MNIIKKPIVSEKATSLNEIANCVSFIVDSRAHKIQIKTAREDTYTVSVKSEDNDIYTSQENKYAKQVFKNKEYIIQKGFSSTIKMIQLIFILTFNNF